jgi:hypothetical protein
VSPSRRVPVVVAILAVLLLGGLVDRRDRPAPSATTLPPVPMAAAADARSSAWYCTGATAARDGAADGQILLFNAGRRPLRGTITVYPNQGEVRRTEVEVAAASRRAVRLADVASAPYASAVVELDGGEAVVELAATGTLGDAVTPCATAASPHWYFADGVTTRDATEVLLLFNPFPDDAILDLVFGTEEGQVTPQALTGLSVRGEAMAVVNVGEFVQRREQVTAAVTARTGRVVVSRLQSFDGSAGRRGMSLALGAAAVGEQWYLPEGLVADGLTQRYHIFNPGAEEATVAIELALEQGDAEPIQLTVPANSRVTVAANEETRIPKGVPHAATVRSVNGVGVVVERSVDAAPAARRTGSSLTPGAQVTARRWALAAGAADDTYDEWLVFQNPGPRTAVVSVRVLSDGGLVSHDSLQGLEVGPGQRRSVRLADTVKGAATPAVVEADQPIVVERDVHRLKGLGTAMSIGIPLRD